MKSFIYIYCILCIVYNNMGDISACLHEHGNTRDGGWAEKENTGHA